MHIKHCQNCSQILSGKFCSHCGQEDAHINESFWHFAKHGVGHYFHFDSKIFNTLKTLVIKPGELTQDYLDGKRARYIPPFNLYIFAIFIYFLIGPHLSNKFSEIRHDKPAEKIRSFDIGFSNYNIQLRQPWVLEEGNLFLGQDTDQFEKTQLEYDQKQSSLPPDRQDGFFKRWLRHRNISIQERTNEHWNFFEGSDHYLSKEKLLSCPLFAILLWLFFRRTHPHYLKHLVFSIHLLTFTMLIRLISLPLDAIANKSIETWLSWVQLIILLIYFYQALRIFYKRPIFETAIKFTLLSVSSNFVALLSAIVFYILAFATI